MVGGVGGFANSKTLLLSGGQEGPVVHHVGENYGQDPRHQAEKLLDAEPHCWNLSCLVSVLPYNAILD